MFAPLPEAGFQQLLQGQEHLDSRFEDMLDRIERFPRPTLCVLNGSVYGGATDLALCCGNVPDRPPDGCRRSRTRRPGGPRAAAGPAAGGTLETALIVSEKSLPVTLTAQGERDRAFETSLSEGVRFEHRVFHSVFATADQKEGMAVFAEKRTARFEHR